MKLILLDENKHHQIFKKIQFARKQANDNDLKVRYSNKILNKCGKFFQVFPPLKKSNRMKGESCYPNSIRKMQNGYQFVEGVITNKFTGQRISHAWNIDPDGRHVDFTIIETDKYEYTGIIVPNILLYSIGERNGNIWYCNLPFLDLEI